MKRITISFLMGMFYYFSLLAQSDLIVSKTIIQPDTGVYNTLIEVSYVLENIGVSDAGTFSVGFYYSDNEVYTPSDVLITTKVISGGIAAGSTYPPAGDGLETISVPAECFLGNRYIVVVADHLNNVSESNESNNYNVDTLVVDKIPDLVPTDISPGSNSIKPEDNLNISYRIKNNGDSRADNVVLRVWYSHDDVLDGGDVFMKDINISQVPAQTFSPKNASGTSAVQMPGNIIEGIRYLFLEVDYGDNVVETDETNNIMSQAINVVVSDLTIKSFASTKTAIEPGGSVPLSTEIINVGSVVNETCKLGFYLSTDTLWDVGDVFLKDIAISAVDLVLSTFKAAVATIPPATTLGDYYLIAYIDHDETLYENDDTNNFAWTPMKVTRPDITFVDFGPNPSATGPGKEFKIEGYLKNNSYVDSKSFESKFYLSADETIDASDLLLDSLQTAKVLSFDSVFFSISDTMPDTTSLGDWYIIYQADNDNALTELSTADNVLAKSITVSQKDIDVLYFELSDDTVAKNLEVDVQYVVKCTDILSTIATSVKYYVSDDAFWSSDDTYLDEIAIDALSPGDSLSITDKITMPADLTGGVWYLLTFLDKDNLIIESDEVNNLVATYIFAQEADLTIASAKAQLVNLQGTSGYSLDIEVENLGPVISNVGKMEYFISVDNTYSADDFAFGENDLQGIAGKTSVHIYNSITFPANIPTGSLYFIIVIDRAEVISETDDNNNTYVVAVNVSTNATTQQFSDYFIAYPNPTNANLTIALTSNQLNVYAVKVLDMAGKELLSQDFNGEEMISISKNSLNLGVNIIELSTDKGIFRSKIIVY